MRSPNVPVWPFGPQAEQRNCRTAFALAQISWASALARALLHSPLLSTFTAAANGEKQMKYIWLLGVAVPFVSSVALAVSPPTWSTSAVTVTNIEVGKSGSSGTQTYLQFSSYPNNNANCSNQTQGLVVGGVDNVKAITAIATSSLLAGKQVRVFLDPGCSVGYGLISRLEIVNN